MKKYRNANVFEPIAAFDVEKAVDLIVFFAARAGQKISKLKLIKLIYLTEREFIRLYHVPSLLDEYHSLPHGPVCSSTLNIINKQSFELKTSEVFWLKGRNVFLKIDPNEWNFDALSRADTTAAERVWAQHGNKTASQLRNYTHRHCPEYTHVEAGRVGISMESLLSAAGVESANEVAGEIASVRRVAAVYA